MDIVDALNTLQPLVLREGDDCELEALSTIRAALAVAQNSSHNRPSAPLKCDHCGKLDSPIGTVVSTPSCFACYERAHL